MVDLDAYLVRIGYAGLCDPTLETLRAIHAAHQAAIPFEAMDALMDRGIDIDPASVDAKLIAGGRGGYCFEQNSLFKRVILTLGYQVEAYVARVCWQMPPDAPPRPRTHQVLKVTIAGDPWLADVGFGGVTVAPMRFDILGQPNPSPYDTFRLVAAGRDVALEAQVAGEWSRVYEISPEPQDDVDYVLPNWFSATHPSSHFRLNLVVARATPAARYTLLNNRLMTRTPDGEVTREMLDVDELERVLRDIIGLPVTPDWRPTLQRAVEIGAP